MQQRPLSLAIAGLLALVPLLSPAEDLDGRVTRIENMLDSQRASDLTLQFQAMEREMQRLRGQVEQQQYELDRLRRQGGQTAGAEARPGAPAGQAPAGGPETAAAAGAPVARGEGMTGPKGAEPARPAEAPTPISASAPAGQPASGTRAGVESTVPPLTAIATPAGTAPPPPPAGTVPTAGEAAQAPAAETPEQPATEPSAAAAQPGRGEQEAYIKAVEPLKQRRFEEASVTLSDFLARYPNSANADKAHFWLAETHYVNRNVTAALKEFQTVLKDYPKSSKVPGALLKIGYIQDDAKDPRAARATLQELIRRFPQSGEARLAQSRLDQMTQEGR